MLQMPPAFFVGMQEVGAGSRNHPEWAAAADVASA